MYILKDKDDSMARLCMTCIKLTSFDKKQINEANFKMRINEHMQIRNQVRDGVKFSILELTAMTYVCCHSLLKEKESSLRSNSLDTINTLCQSIRLTGKTANLSLICKKSIILDGLYLIYT